VVAVAVELHRQLVLRPAAVDVEAAVDLVRLGELEVVGLQESEEAAFELAQGDGLAVEDRAQVGGALAVRSARQDGFDLVGFDPIEDAGLVPGSA
jgi:hypothetical protein